MTLKIFLAIACAGLMSQGPHAEPTQPPAVAPVVQQKSFPTPEAASEALVAAAERFDVAALLEIVGPDGEDLVVTQDPVLDKKHAEDFVTRAHERMKIVKDPNKPNVAIMTLGEEDWPAPIPIVKKGGVWRFDSKAGRAEVLYRRIGANELNAIGVCRGYVEAQFDYASEPHDGASVNQYARRIISTPGKQDGLAWRDSAGIWQGPVGEDIAKVIAEGYHERYDPFHGYYFKILKGQGPAAPMGEMDYMVKGLMIGGFAMVAAPADYLVTGVMTFIVSNTGVVYQKDLGPKSVDQFRAMERFNPDPTWKPVTTPQP
jgi:hypothetical protein